MSKITVEIGSKIAATMATSKYLAATIIPMNPPWRSANMMTLSSGFARAMIPAAPIRVNAADTVVKFIKSKYILFHHDLFFYPS